MKLLSNIPYILLCKPMWLTVMAIVYLSCSPKVNHIASISESTYRIDELYLEEDKDIESKIAPFRQELATKMDIVLGTVDQDLNKDKPNSPLSNFMADAMLDKARESYDGHVDIAIQNYGGIRLNSIGAGYITTRTIYELMPFDNTLVILEVDAMTLQNLLDRIADYGGWPISKGTQFTIGEDQKAKNIIVDGYPFDLRKTYTLALPDYVANGGDKSDYFKDAKRYDTGIFIRDLLIDNVKKYSGIKANNEKRILHEQ